jgi:hypothetical protein
MSDDDDAAKAQRFGGGRRAGVGSRAAIGLIALALLGVTAGAVLYNFNAPHVRIIDIELDGTAQRWPLATGASDAVRWDFVFIAGYALSLAAGIWLALAVFWTPQAHKIAEAAASLGIAAVAADVLENACLLASDRSKGLLNVGSAAAVTKFCCLIPAALVAVAGVIISAERMFLNRRSNLERRTTVRAIVPPPTEPDDPDVPGSRMATAAGGSGGEDRWRRGFTVPDLSDGEVERRATAADPTTGFCLSGGGVRSASVALGAIQELRAELIKAKYLVSVSGGGYVAGALQLAMTDAPDPAGDGVVIRDPTSALMPGSVDEDRIRRHADYLASSTAEIVVALAVLARVLVASLVLIFSTAIVAGIAVGRLYHVVPFTTSDLSTTLYPWRPDVSFPGVRTGTWIALVAFAGLSFVLYIASLFSDTVSGAFKGGASEHRATYWMRLWSTLAACLGLLVSAFTLVIPGVVFGSAWFLSRSGATAVSVAGSTGAVVLTYGAALAGFARRSKVITRARSSLSKGGGVPGSVPSGLLQRLLAVVTLAVLGAAWLLLFGGMAAVSGRPDALWFAVVVGAGLAILGGALDQTELSLHPFYRKKLAAAFPLRRIRKNGDLIAAGYREHELTNLSTYAKGPANFPQFVFAAAANLTGEQRAPLNAASYTFTADWVGGPDIGYLRTDELEAAVAPQLRRDLTVEAAVAISGAAVASAMGRQSQWFGALLAVSGVRLGTWLPNPGFVAQWNLAKVDSQWVLPGIPRIRRLTYLLREIFGSHRFTDRLLQITDGGHYENLGLLELLRRRCTEIYCIDASGDSPPTAGTLAQAITLARAELGVEIELSDAWSLVPGSAKNKLKPEDPLANLNARLCESAVVIGRIKYPEASGMPLGCRGGTLVVAKALLTQDHNYDLLSYAARNPIFPHDSTGDQFFDDGKFCAYLELGRGIAAKARQAIDVAPRKWRSEDD